jgi:hypothetical protein
LLQLSQVFGGRNEAVVQWSGYDDIEGLAVLAEHVMPPFA